MTSTPLPFIWDGEAFRPLNRQFAKRCDQQFVVGEKYNLEAIEERSARSHKHYFAEIRTAWENLPEDIASKFSTPEHLRKRALIMTGYCDEVSVVTSSKAQALMIAAFIEPIDDYSLVSTNGPVVIRKQAKSQNMRAMDKQTFQASKTAVLEYIADLIGVTPAALQAQARAA